MWLAGGFTHRLFNNCGHPGSFGCIIVIMDVVLISEGGGMRLASKQDLELMEERLTHLIKATAADSAEISALARKLKLSSDALKGAVQSESLGGQKAEPPQA